MGRVILDTDYCLGPEISVNNWMNMCLNISFNYRKSDVIVARASQPSDESQRYKTPNNSSNLMQSVCAFLSMIVSPTSVQIYQMPHTSNSWTDPQHMGVSKKMATALLSFFKSQRGGGMYKHVYKLKWLWMSHEHTYTCVLHLSCTCLMLVSHLSCTCITFVLLETVTTHTNLYFISCPLVLHCSIVLHFSRAHLALLLQISYTFLALVLQLSCILDMWY